MAKGRNYKLLCIGETLHFTNAAAFVKGAPVPKRVMRWPTDLGIPGSSPLEAKSSQLQTGFHCI